MSGVPPLRHSLKKEGKLIVAPRAHTGVKTNIPFLFRVLSHPAFVEGKTWTTFIDDTPELFQLVTSQNRAQKLLSYLGDLAVNGSSIKGQQGEPGLHEEIPIPAVYEHGDEAKPIDTSVPCQNGWRNIIKEKGPEGFAKAVREYPGVLIMDTTWVSHQFFVWLASGRRPERERA